MVRNTRTNRLDNGIESLRTCCSISVNAVTPYSVHPVFGTRSFAMQWIRKLSIHFCGDDNTVTLVLRTIISINQLSISGHVRRTGWQNLFSLFRKCRETCCSKQFGGQLECQHNCQQSTKRFGPRTVQGHLLLDYKQKAANFPDHLHLTRLCSN